MDMYTLELSFNVGTCSPGLQHQAGDDPPLVVNALVALQAMKRHGRLLCFAKLQCSASETHSISPAMLSQLYMPCSIMNLPGLQERVPCYSGTVVCIIRRGIHRCHSIGPPQGVRRRTVDGCRKSLSKVSSSRNQHAMVDLGL